MQENELYMRQLEPNNDDYFYICYRPVKGHVRSSDPLTVRYLDYTFKTRSQTDYVYCKVPKSAMHSFLMAFDSQVFDDGKSIEEVFPIAKKRKVLQTELVERWKKK